MSNLYQKDHFDKLVSIKSKPMQRAGKVGLLLSLFCLKDHFDLCLHFIETDRDGLITELKKVDEKDCRFLLHSIET